MNGANQGRISANQTRIRRKSDANLRNILAAGRGQCTEALDEAVTEAHKRWGTGPVTMKATTLNHGGIVVRLREAVGTNAALRHESRTAGAETTQQQKYGKGTGGYTGR